MKTPGALSRKDFNNKLRRLGFRQTLTLGIWRLPMPFSGTRVDERNGGETLRARLAWMLGELDKATAAYLDGDDKS
jgi:hypothetical protein